METSENTANKGSTTSRDKCPHTNGSSTNIQTANARAAAVTSHPSGGSNEFEQSTTNSVCPAHSTLSGDSIGVHPYSHSAPSVAMLRDNPSASSHYGRHSDNAPCLGAEQILSMDVGPPMAARPEPDQEPDDKLFLDRLPNEHFLKPIYSFTKPVSGEMMEETSIFNATPVFSPTDKSSSTDAGTSAHDDEMRTPEATSDHSPDSPPEDRMAQDTDEREPSPEANVSVPNVHYLEQTLAKTSIDCRATHSEGAICTDDIAIDHGRTSADSSRTSKKFSQPKQPKLPRKTCHGIKRAIKPPKKDAKYWTLRYWCNWRGCEWRFATPYNLERHILMHARQEGLMSEVPMIPCPVDGCKTQCTRKENICSHLWEGHQIREKCPCCGKTFESGEKSYGSDELYKHLTHPASTCGVKLVRIDKSAVTGFNK